MNSADRGARVRHRRGSRTRHGRSPRPGARRECESRRWDEQADQAPVHGADRVVVRRLGVAGEGDAAVVDLDEFHAHVAGDRSAGEFPWCSTASAGTTSRSPCACCAPVARPSGSPVHRTRPSPARPRRRRPPAPRRRRGAPFRPDPASRAGADVGRPPRKGRRHRHVTSPPPLVPCPRRPPAGPPAPLLSISRGEHPK